MLHATKLDCALHIEAIFGSKIQPVAMIAISSTFSWCYRGNGAALVVQKEQDEGDQQVEADQQEQQDVGEPDVGLVIQQLDGQPVLQCVPSPRAAWPSVHRSVSKPLTEPAAAFVVQEEPDEPGPALVVEEEQDEPRPDLVVQEEQDEPGAALVIQEQQQQEFDLGSLIMMIVWFLSRISREILTEQETSDFRWGILQAEQMLSDERWESIQDDLATLGNGQMHLDNQQLAQQEHAQTHLDGQQTRMDELMRRLELVERDNRWESIQRQTRMDELARRLELIERNMRSTMVPGRAREVGIQLLHTALRMVP